MPHIAPLPPLIIAKMLKTEGVYIVSDRHIPNAFARVYVDEKGVCHQLKEDGVLSPDGWNSTVTVRGPINLDSPFLGE